MEMIFKDIKIPLIMSKYDYERLASEIMSRYEKQFSKEEQNFIEVLVLREIDKIRKDLQNIVKEEVKIQLKDLKWLICEPTTKGT